jgi:hypothetical protein
MTGLPARPSKEAKAPEEREYRQEDPRGEGIDIFLLVVAQSIYST